ncbi:MAG: hypothetical protein H7836_04540 [Magnetococcus sp. YQC-3]
MDLQNKSINQLGAIVAKEWVKPYFGAVPYIKALQQINDGKYLFEDEKTIVIYFLSNARTWKGDIAKEVKQELKRRHKLT